MSRCCGARFRWTASLLLAVAACLPACDAESGSGDSVAGTGSGGTTAGGAPSEGGVSGEGGGSVHGCAPLQGEVTVSYYAQSDGVDRLVVIHESGTDSMDFRVFFGTPARMEERPVENATRALDGGTTSIQFDMGGTQASVRYPSPLSAEYASPTLTLSGQATELTPLDVAQASEDLTFFCLGSGG